MDSKETPVGNIKDVINICADRVYSAINTSSEMTCPHCQKAFPVKFSLLALDEQIVTMRIAYQGTGLQAKTLWKVMQSMESALKLTGKDLGGKIEVMIAGLEHTEHDVTVKFLVIDQKAVNR